jgi:hypothetical protein
MVTTGNYNTEKKPTEKQTLEQKINGPVIGQNKNMDISFLTTQE